MMNRDLINQTMSRWQEVVESSYDPKLIKQAIGIATDKRYAGTNFSGAYKTIEKLKTGLADHPQVAAVLKRANEANKLDPVDDKANDKKFVNRKDKDIDNDGDVDSSDEYLHKRRKAIDNEIDGGKKPAKNESVELDEALKTTHVVIDTADGNMIVSTASNEKLAKGSIVSAELPPMNIKDKKTLKVVQLKKPVSLNKDIIGLYLLPATKSVEEAKSVSHEEYGFGEVINSTENGMDILFSHGMEFNVQVESVEVFEKTYIERTKGAAKGETMSDKYKGKGAHDMADDADAKDPKIPKGGDDAIGHEDATKAGRATKQSPVRPNDSKIGDKKIVNPVKGAVNKTTGKE